MSVNTAALRACAEQPCCFPETGRDGEPCWCADNWGDDIRLYCPSCLARWQLAVIDGDDDTCDEDERDWKHDVRN